MAYKGEQKRMLLVPATETTLHASMSSSPALILNATIRILRAAGAVQKNLR